MIDAIDVLSGGAMDVLGVLGGLVGVININVNPVLIDAGGFEVTWHGFFTAAGIALGVWLSIRLARRSGLNEDDAMSIAVVAVISGIVGARLLWVFEHLDQIENAGDLFALTDGGISVYGAMIGGVVGSFVYVSLFKPKFPKWRALDVAAPGMILGQGVGRLGDLINGEHFAKASELPWAFRYTHPSTDGPWAQFTDGAAPEESGWYRGARDLADEGPVSVHPVAGGMSRCWISRCWGCCCGWRRGRLVRVGGLWCMCWRMRRYGVVCRCCGRMRRRRWRGWRCRS